MRPSLSEIPIPSADPAVALKRFIKRETDCYVICTRTTIIDAFRGLPCPWDWAVWVIIVP
jgi:hypothetical protein